MMDLPIAVAADRMSRCAPAGANRSNPDCIVLDDAFSHLKFQTSAECIVIPADSLHWYETLPLPAGPMRELWTARSNAQQYTSIGFMPDMVWHIESFHPRVRALWESLNPGDRVLTGTG